MRNEFLLVLIFFRSIVFFFTVCVFVFWLFFFSRSDFSSIYLNIISGSIIVKTLKFISPLTSHLQFSHLHVFPLTYFDVVASYTIQCLPHRNCASKTPPVTVLIKPLIKKTHFYLVRVYSPASFQNPICRLW